MFSLFMDRYVISITKFFEGLLTIINLFVLCAHIILLGLAATGISYRIDDTSLLYICYLLLWGITLVELLLTLLQRFVVKISNPYPLSRLEAVVSPAKAMKRFLYRVYLESFLYIVLVLIANYFRKYWLGENFPGGWWGKYVSTMNLLIPLTSIAAKELHAKLWKTIMP